MKLARRCVLIGVLLTARWPWQVARQPVKQTFDGWAAGEHSTCLPWKGEWA